jgi:hypothetical protein
MLFWSRGMSFIDFFNWFPSTWEQTDFFITFLGIIFISVYVLAPRKDQYKNVFLAWLAYLASTILTMGLLYFLLTRKLAFLNIGPGVNTFYWGAISVPIFLLNMALMNAITKILKIRRLPVAKEDRVGGVGKRPRS